MGLTHGATFVIVLGKNFEREIFEQPEVWERVAHAGAANRLARAIEGPVLLIGSGSSSFVAQLGALALRRHAIDAQAVFATEARGDRNAYQDRTVIAISQSGRSSDLLDAIGDLRIRRLIALTNSADSPLAGRADITIDIGAWSERAIPATKSVTASIAILLGAASAIGGSHSRDPQVLLETAAAVRAWLTSGRASVAEAAAQIATRRDIVVLGTDYGAPIAREVALKFKEATYLHAEGFEAGEFRHGSTAMVDRESVAIGIVDRDGERIVTRAMSDLASSGAFRVVLGQASTGDIPSLGAIVPEAYNTLAWLVAAQRLALDVARARGVDSDAPRGLKKAITE